jgi:nitrous oxidase accessory protein
MRRNRITGRPELESGSRGGGFHLWDSPRNVLEDNIVTHARDGMYVQNSPDNTFRRNRVSNLRYGLHFMSSDNNSFEDNVFHDNVAGAAIMYSQNIQLRRNTFVHNRGFSSFGILFQDCRQCVAEENLVLDNEVGIFLEAAKSSVFRNNTIAENDVAMQIFTSSDQNTFTANNFINNISPLQLVGKASSTKWQSEQGGNYWSDYGGYDMDGDGLGDVPHRIHNVFEYLEGNYPRLRIYLNSPAAQAIVVAEKSFPILVGSNEFDRVPLMRPVKITTQFVPKQTDRRAMWILVAFSSMMLGLSVVVFTRGLTR